MDKVDRIDYPGKESRPAQGRAVFRGFVEHDPDTGKWTAQGQLFGGKIRPCLKNRYCTNNKEV